MFAVMSERASANKAFNEKCNKNDSSTKSNEYAKRQGARNWSDVTTAELSAFMGLHVVCSVLYLSWYKQAWKTKRPFSFPAVPDTMTRSRFENIQIYFHCNDTRNNPARGQSNQDKRCHIRRILDVVLAMCKENYIPDKEQAIDEAMIGFKAGLGYGSVLIRATGTWVNSKSTLAARGVDQSKVW